MKVTRLTPQEKTELEREFLELILTNHSILYFKSHPDAFNREKVHCAWTEVLEGVGENPLLSTVQDCKELWKSLLGQYRNFKSRSVKRSGAGIPKIYFRHADFLKTYEEQLFQAQQKKEKAGEEDRQLNVDRSCGMDDGNESDDTPQVISEKIVGRAVEKVVEVEKAPDRIPEKIPEKRRRRARTENEDPGVVEAWQTEVLKLMKDNLVQSRAVEESSKSEFDKIGEVWGKKLKTLSDHDRVLGLECEQEVNAVFFQHLKVLLTSRK